ncbi:MAG: glycosyltransferase family 2 protein [Solirubrobacteraceae bacterium]
MTVSPETTNDAEDVTLAVLNYNGRDLLPVILTSIFEQTARGFRVHVLDDASSDDSLVYLAEHWPQVRVLPSSANLGISASMARAVASAETTYVAVLNNDLELDPRWLAEMRATLERHPEAAAADGKMLNFHRRGELDGAGDTMGRDGYPRRRGQGEPDTGQYDEPGEVFSATGGAALFRRGAFDAVGPFDSDLGAYYEDVDWGFRARLRGMTVRYAPTAVSYHMGSATTSRDSGRYAALIVRNQTIVVLKDFPAALLLRHLQRILFFELKWAIFNALHGLGGAHARGLLAAARALPGTLRKRRAIQRLRSAPTHELERALS